MCYKQVLELLRTNRTKSDSRATSVRVFCLCALYIFLTFGQTVLKVLPPLGGDWNCNCIFQNKRMKKAGSWGLFQQLFVYFLLRWVFGGEWCDFEKSHLIFFFYSILMNESMISLGPKFLQTVLSLRKSFYSENPINELKTN